MIAKVKGQLISVNKKMPEKNDNFEAHQLLSVLQVSDQGEAEIVKVKDENYDRPWDVTKLFDHMCRIFFWKGNNGNSGLSVKVI